MINNVSLLTVIDGYWHGYYLAYYLFPIKVNKAIFISHKKCNYEVIKPYLYFIKHSQSIADHNFKVFIRALSVKRSVWLSSTSTRNYITSHWEPERLCVPSPISSQSPIVCVKMGSIDWLEIRQGHIVVSCSIYYLASRYNSSCRRQIYTVRLCCKLNRPQRSSTQWRVPQDWFDHYLILRWIKSVDCSSDRPCPLPISYSTFT